MQLVHNTDHSSFTERRADSSQHSFRGFMGRAWLLLFCAALPACGGGILAPRGPVGDAEKTILVDSLVIMLAIVVPTIVATGAFAWWYRASNTRARHLPDWAYSGQLELVVWFIPAMVIILLSGVTWIGTHALDPAKSLDGAKATEVQVISLDWKWLFIYPQYGVASLNEVELPAGQPVHFSLTSASVMNAFFVPQLGSMIYTMNGMVTQLNLRADAPGTFPGLSAHYSGEGFSDMHFDLHAVTAEEFSGWVDSVRLAGGVLETRTYVELTRQGTRAPMTFGSVEPGLFDRVARGFLAAGPGPSTQHAGAAQAPVEAH